MKKNPSSAKWLAEHESDQYVKQARLQGYRSRAAFKLADICKKHPLLKPGMTVVDLGAAPGGWSQVAVKAVGEAGQVIACDLLDMPPIANVRFIQGDFTDQAVLDQLLSALDGKQPDLVISDMAPNLSGNKAIDQPRSMHLLELVLDFADTALRPGGNLVAKAFEGEGIDDVRQACRARFKRLVNFKPDASRPRSREIYLIGQGFKGA